MIKDYLDQQITALNNEMQTAYLLNNQELFYDTGFRVMKNQERSCLVPCHKLKYNGKIKLVYFTSEYITLEQMLKNVNAEYTGMLISNLMQAIAEVKGNGFLNISYLDIRMDKIYVDKNTYAVKLIYLPVSIPGTGDLQETIECEVRAQLIHILQERKCADTPDMQSLLESLKDATVPFSLLADKKHVTISQPTETVHTCIETGIVMMALDHSHSFTITGDEYLIGKSADKVDGVIAGNSAISRVHCKVIKRDRNYYLMDMNSANGTFVNNQRIAHETPVEIGIGTRVKLANMEFIVRR